MSDLSRIAERWGPLLTLGAAAACADALPPLDEIVMYEANVRQMSGAGDLDGVTARLDQIAALGVNTIWLMPIHPVGVERRFGTLGSPYSVRDHLAVGGEYGTIDDLHELIDAAHARGIAVILDWVANHTAWDHPWITDHPEWYTTDDQGNIVHPPGTPWLDVADLDYGVPEMRSAMIDQMIWWVRNTGIDGFRMDAPDFVPFDFWAEAIPAVRASVERPLLMFAEGARADHHRAGFELTFGWRFFDGLEAAFVHGSPATEIGRAHLEEYAPVPAGNRVLRWTTNHDETAYDAPPPVLFGGLDASLAAYAAMVMHGGTPLVYSGQEVGSTDNTSIVEEDPIDWADPEGVADWYAWILGIRRQHASIRTGGLADRSSPDALLVARTLGDERVAALINTRGWDVSADIPAGWVSDWTDLESGQPRRLEGTLPLAPHGIALLRQDVWPGYVAGGALQTEQGDPADWDPANSSLVFDRDGPVYTVRADNLAEGVWYGLEIVTDRARPPVDNADPRVAAGLVAVGDADGSVTITVDGGATNNKNGPVVWIDTDSAPLQAVGNFMDEAGGAGDWNPADPAFAMTPLGRGRYAYSARLGTPGVFAFKASFGQGWGHQVGTDGLSDDARVLTFETTAPGQFVRLLVDLRGRALAAWTGGCHGADLAPPAGVLDLSDISEFIDAFLAGDAGADLDGNGVYDLLDISGFAALFVAGCP